jgi:hypothetical protein
MRCFSLEVRSGFPRSAVRLALLDACDSRASGRLDGLGLGCRIRQVSAVQGRGEPRRQEEGACYLDWDVQRVSKIPVTALQGKKSPIESPNITQAGSPITFRLVRITY